MAIRIGTRVALGLLGLALGLTVAAGPAGAKTLLILDSDPGDYVGQGRLQQLGPVDGTFGASKNFDEGVGVTFDGSDFWSLDFAAAGAVPLVLGLYDDATRFPFQSPTEPGLDVSGAGRGCNELRGAFRVHEIAYGAGDAVDAFAADFVQHCEGSPRRLVGAIRFNASDALPDVFDTDGDGEADIGDNCEGDANADQRDSDIDGAGDVCDPTLEASFVVLDSEEGDYIGQGERAVFHGGNSLLVPTLNNDGGVTMRVESGDYWTLDFTAAGGGAPVPGAYGGATRWPFNGPTEPGLSVSGAGRGCNELGGRFDVFELEVAPNGDVLRFSADFEQHCEGGEPALHGSVRWHAAFLPGPRDLDGDGSADKEDNCPGIANTLQVDADLDGRGDGCGLDPAAQRCVNEMNKRGAALAKAQGAASLACLKNAAKGATEKLGTPATPQDCLTNDVGGKLASGGAKLVAREASVCPAGSPPAFGYVAGSAVRDAAVARGVARVAALFGADLDTALRTVAVDPVGAKCQEDVLRTTGAAVDALLKIALKHKKAVLAAQKVLGADDAESLGAALRDAIGSASNPKVAKAVGGVASAAAKRCAAVTDLAAAFPGCAAAADAAAVAACGQAAARCDACRTLEAFDGLTLDCDAFDDGDDANASCP